MDARGSMNITASGIEQPRVRRSKDHGHLGDSNTSSADTNGSVTLVVIPRLKIAEVVFNGNCGRA